ncbi:MAG TPA: DUF4159 domain-containing protein [Terriglobia bacterium]|nr:DUF4159 domain-containing protein [Terriglobia bacterium]
MQFIRRSAVGVLILFLLSGAISYAQRGRFNSNSAALNNTPPENSEFVLARWHYTAGWGGGGWVHDFPTAEEHITQIMNETTGIRTNRLSYRIVELDSPEIFKYPFSYVSEPGEMRLTDHEIENLREYIERGGFVMIDDFGGQRTPEIEFEHFQANLIRAFPGREMFRLTDEHPLLHVFYDVDGLYMEHPMTYVKADFFGFEDSKGRLAMIICFNNDVGDYWEFIDQPVYRLKPSAEALKLGINFVMYSMTH